MGERREIRDAYYDWLLWIINPKKQSIREYDLLLRHLFDTDFRYIMAMDENRFEDGISLRYRFGSERGVPHVEVASYLDIYPCSVLEMMVALALRSEEDLMSDPDIGDRTGKWFWQFIRNLGLKEMTNGNYDVGYVSQVLDRFMDRQYEKNGTGGLIITNDPNKDMRDIEIWYQMMGHLNEYYEKEYRLI